MTPLVVRQTLAIVGKDLRRELRTREVATTTIAFAILLIVIFAFGFYRSEESLVLVFPGTLWIAVVFTGSLALGRTFQHESQGDCLKAMALIPGSEISLYLGKFIINLIFMLLFEAALLPMMVLSFGVDLSDALLTHLLALFVGTLGFAALGTLVSAMLVRNDLREVLLPIVLYPLLVPILIAGVVVTATLIEGGTTEDVMPWIRAMLAMDLAYGILCIGLFRWVLSAIE